MTTARRITATDNIALLRADYEAGLCSKRKISQIHNISEVTLWRYAKEECWEYGRKRDAVMEEGSVLSAKRLLTQREEILEQHAITLAKLREQLMDAEDLTAVRVLKERAEALLRCIKAERLCYGLPSDLSPSS